MRNHYINCDFAAAGRESCLVAQSFLNCILKSHRTGATTQAGFMINSMTGVFSWEQNLLERASAFVFFSARGICNS